MQVSAGSCRQRARCAGIGGPGPCLGHTSGHVEEDDPADEAEKTERRKR